MAFLELTDFDQGAPVKVNSKCLIRFCDGAAPSGGAWLSLPNGQMFRVSETTADIQAMLTTAGETFIPPPAPTEEPPTETGLVEALTDGNPATVI